MRYSVCCAVLLPVLLAGLVPSPTYAQSENPIQAAKDAWKKATQQNKPQKQAQQPATASQQGSTQQTTAASPSGSAAAPQDAAAPWSPSDDASSAKTPNQSDNQPVKLDPTKLPDVVGVRLGMTGEEAVAALHKTYPADMYAPTPVNSWPSSPKPVYGFNVISREPGNFNDVSVSFTAPPGPQIVWRITRATQHMHVNKNTLLAAIREKYGKETVAYANNFVSKDDRQINQLIWIYDEQGNRLPLPPSTIYRNPNAGIAECAIGAGTTSPVMPQDDDWGHDFAPWCAQHLVYLNISLANGDIVEYTNTTLADIPLAKRTGHAAAVWLHDYAMKQHQDDLERAKAKKPVL